MAPRVIVMTGESGEIGRPVAAALRAGGHRVEALADWRGGRPDLLVHLAGAGPHHSRRRLVDSNVVFLETVLQRAESELGAPDFVLASSASVYGQPEAEALAEDAPLWTGDVHAAAKRLGETMLATYGGRGLALRMPGVLELTRASNFICRSFERLQAGEPVTLTNAHRRFNHYLAMSELARFIATLELTAPFDAVNLAGPAELTLGEALEHLAATLKSRSSIAHSDATQPFFNLSISKAIDSYGYSPHPARTTLSEWCCDRLQGAEST